MSPPNPLQLPNPTSHGQHIGGGGIPSAPSYYALGSSAARRYPPPPTESDWPEGFPAKIVPPQEPQFTDDMRNLQARGKDPYQYTRRDDPYYNNRLESVRATERTGCNNAHAATTNNDQYHLSPKYVRPPSPGPKLPGEPPLDNFANLERRRHASIVLDSPELLMMYAQSMGDSIPSVRMTFMRIMCGYDADTTLSPSVIAETLAAAAAEASYSTPSHDNGHGYDHGDSSNSMGKRKQSISSVGGSANGGNGSSSGNGGGSSNGRLSRGKLRKRRVLDRP